MKSVLFIVLLFPLAVSAQDGEVVLSVLDKVLLFISSIDGAAIGVLAVVLEFILRLIPSQKPLGVLRLVAAVARIVGNVLVKGADILDKVLPQNIKK